MTDPKAAEAIGWAHVLELRAVVEARGLTHDDIEARGDASDKLIRDLEGAKLLVWDGGSRATPGTGVAYGTWGPVEIGAVVVTVAGHAFLRGYDLGLQRKGADAMARAMPKPKPGRPPK